jgi:hypothetical protein
MSMEQIASLNLPGPCQGDLIVPMMTPVYGLKS